jgi:hypothetical protein
MIRRGRARQVSETACKSHKASLGGHGIEQQEQAECAQTQVDRSHGHVNTADLSRNVAAARFVRMEHAWFYTGARDGNMRMAARV